MLRKFLKVVVAAFLGVLFGGAVVAGPAAAKAPAPASVVATDVRGSSQPASGDALRPLLIWGVTAADVRR